jgi:TldD protein
LKEFLFRALDFARLRGAQYADIRVVDKQNEFTLVKNGQPESLKNFNTFGFGVRVLVDGSWGFASSSQLNDGELDRVTRLAIEIGKSSALVQKYRVNLGPAVTSQGVYCTPVAMDPFTVSLDEKIAVLMEADRALAKEKGIKVRSGQFMFQKEHRWFANSEGALTEQTIIETGAGITVWAVGEGEVQVRSYPNSFGRNQVTGGWEIVKLWDLPGHAPRIASEAVALLTADACPTGITTDIIISGNQLGLQIHESCGHPAELDRVLGSEISLAGGSFLTPEKLGTFQYGSTMVNLTADSIRPFGLGTFGWDDEGIPAQSNYLVKEGLFVGYLMSRETASQIGRQSNGCMRAMDWSRIPIVRMVNINLEPGSWALEDLIADTDHGIYVDTNRSWSIDDRRYNFQFGTEIGYEIKNGKLGRMLRNPTYTGITPQFWNSCDAVCNEKHWQMWGTPNCGKGEPGQEIHTGHGAAPARFRNIKVGVF